MRIKQRRESKASGFRKQWRKHNRFTFNDTAGIAAAELVVASCVWTFHEPLILRLSEIHPVLCLDWSTRGSIHMSEPIFGKFERGTNDRDYLSSLFVLQRLRTDLPFWTPPRFIKLLMSGWGKPETVPEYVAIYEVYPVSYAYLLQQQNLQ